MGEPSLRPAQGRLRSATGDDMGVTGSIPLRGWCDEQLVKLIALVATRATRSLSSASEHLSFVYDVDMKPTHYHSSLRHSNGGSVLLPRSGDRDILVVRVAVTKEVNAITSSTMKREVESLKSELRALHTGHLSMKEMRLPRTPEEKHRHEANGHAEYDNRCEISVTSSAISRPPHRVFSGSCTFDYAGVSSFKEANEFATVLTSRGPRGECFCRVAPRRGQRMKELETFLAVLRARDPSLQVRSNNEESLKHVLTAACEEVHLEYSNTRLKTQASNGQRENSVPTVREFVQKQKKVNQCNVHHVLFQTHCLCFGCAPQ